MTVNSPANHLFEWGTEELAPFLTPHRERWRSFGVEVSASVTVPLSGPDREQQGPASPTSVSKGASHEMARCEKTLRFRPCA
jgi:hypothetical protein